MWKSIFSDISVLHIKYTRNVLMGFWISSSIFARVSWIRAYIVAFNGIAVWFGIITSCFIVVVKNDGFELLNIQREIYKKKKYNEAIIDVDFGTDRFSLVLFSVPLWCAHTINTPKHMLANINGIADNKCGRACLCLSRCKNLTFTIIFPFSNGIVSLHMDQHSTH